MLSVACIFWHFYIYFLIDRATPHVCHIQIPSFTRTNLYILFFISRIYPLVSKRDAAFPSHFVSCPPSPSSPFCAQFILLIDLSCVLCSFHSFLVHAKHLLLLLQIHLYSFSLLQHLLFCTLLHRFLLLLGVIPFINHLSLSIRYSLCTLFCSSYFNLKIANLRWYRLFHHALIL
eukprot:935302_1